MFNRLSYSGTISSQRRFFFNFAQIFQDLEEDCNTHCVYPKWWQNLILKYIATQPHYHHDGHSDRILDKRIFIANFKCPACYHILPANTHNMHLYVYLSCVTHMYVACFLFSSTNPYLPFTWHEDVVRYFDMGV